MVDRQPARTGWRPRHGAGSPRLGLGRPRTSRQSPINHLTSRRMFVSFEGLDGCGKTTQARLLARALEEAGVEVVLTREPGGTQLGEQIRDLVLHGDHVAPWAETALYAAARAQHVEELIRPALAR